MKTLSKIIGLTIIIVIFSFEHSGAQANEDSSQTDTIYKISSKKNSFGINFVSVATSLMGADPSWELLSIDYSRKISKKSVFRVSPFFRGRSDYSQNLSIDSLISDSAIVTTSTYRVWENGINAGIESYVGNQRVKFLIGLYAFGSYEVRESDFFTSLITRGASIGIPGGFYYYWDTLNTVERHLKYFATKIGLTPCFGIFVLLSDRFSLSSRFEFNIFYQVIDISDNNDGVSTLETKQEVSFDFHPFITDLSFSFHF